MFNKAVLKEIEKSMSSLKHDGYNKHTVKSLERSLNQFFTDSECKEVIFTENLSKPFFGMCVYVILDSKTTQDILTDDDSVRLSKYVVEIDSKIFTEKNLTTKEATACLLHEIGHVVNDSYPVNVIRQAIDSYMVETKQNIKYVDSSAYWNFLSYGIQDSIRRITSIFCKDDYEIIADEFVVLCGYGNELESAFKKISNGGLSGVRDKSLKSKLTVLDWTLRTYNQMGLMRSNSIRTLNKIKSLTGSKAEIESINKAIDTLQEVNPTLQIRECKITDYDGEIVIENGFLYETTNKKSLVSRIQKKGLRGVEEDVYEYQMRIRNVEDELEAINILRQINTRMAMLEDWIDNNPEDVNIERYQKCYNKYDLLRDELTSKTTYTSKNYQIWFDYDALDNKR